MGIRVARMSEQPIGRGAFDDAAGIHHDDVVRDFRDHRQIMADELDRHADAVLQIQHQIENLRLDGDIERGGGFIGDQQRRFTRQGHRDHGALAHAAGELVRIGDRALFRRVDADGFELADGEVFRLRPANAFVQHQHLGDLPADLHHRVQRRHRFLEDHRHALAAQRPPVGRGLAEQIAPGEADLAADMAGRWHQPHQGQRRHRLAAAAFADHTQGAAGVDAVVDAGNHEAFSVLAGKGDAEPFHRQQGGRHYWADFQFSAHSMDISPCPVGV